MNRILKFRAWDKFNEYMEYGIDDLPIWCLKLGEDTEGNLCVFQQYTGLKDKNGKEIYEGDVVSDMWNNLYTPVFQNGIYMAYNPKHLGLKNDPSTQFNIIWKDGCEIIGNIYENPELLKGADE